MSNVLNSSVTQMTSKVFSLKPILMRSYNGMLHTKQNSFHSITWWNSWKCLDGQHVQPPGGRVLAQQCIVPFRSFHLLPGEQRDDSAQRRPWDSSESFSPEGEADGCSNLPGRHPTRGTDLTFPIPIRLYWRQLNSHTVAEEIPIFPLKKPWTDFMQYHMKKKDKILMNKSGPKLLISQ